MKKSKLLDVNGIVIQFLTNGYIFQKHLMVPDQDNELYFYDQAPLIINEKQEIIDEISFTIRLLQWNELSESFRNVDFYFSVGDKIIRHNGNQEIEEHIMRIMKRIINDSLFLKWIRQFVKFEMRNRKIDKLLI